jgi:SAM-dependent methyltransferase
MALSERTIPVTVAAADGDCGGGGFGPREYNERIVWLTVRQRPGGVGPGSTGLAVWNSGLLLSRLLQRLGTVPSPSASPSCPRFDSWLRGKSVLELGCGAGLGSLTCAALGASRVWATDGNPEAVELALENARANRLDSAVLPRVLPWGLLAAADYEDSADVVVGSDLTYNSGSWRLLAETMAAVLKPDGRVLYVTAGHAGFPARAEVEGFLAVARENGLVQVSSASDPLWPFGPTALSGTAGRDLSDLLVEDCLWSASEREIAESSGGVRAVLLARKSR